jgi:hypothetical protein
VADIFDEVDEELRAERAQQLLKRYGALIVAGALVIVGAAAGWQGWRWYEARQDQAASLAYLAAMNLADATAAGSSDANRSAAIAAFTRLVATAPKGYATLSRLREAALKADAGDRPGAIALWDQLASDPTTDPILRDLASLLWAQHQVGDGDPSLIEARLKPLTASANPWHALAEEQMSLLDLREGKVDQARTTLRQLTHDITAPSGVRGRATALLGRLGG